MVCAPVRRDNPRALARGLSTVQAHKPCSISRTKITSVDLAHYGVSRAKDWVSVDCGTIADYCIFSFFPGKMLVPKFGRCEFQQL